MSYYILLQAANGLVVGLIYGSVQEAGPSRKNRVARMPHLPSVFREVGVRGFPVRRTAAHDAALPERYDCPRSATSRAKSPATRTRQHVTVSGVVPAH